MFIRKLTEEDIEALWNLRLRALQGNAEAFSSTYEEALQGGIERMRHRLRHPSTDAFYIGAFEDGSLVGMVGYYREPRLKTRHNGLIVGMYVTPEQRGRGVGKQLVAEAIAQARIIPGLEHLLLAVVTTNIAARRLYRSLGFEMYGVQPRALKQDGQYWDEELMILRLHP